eukprot:755683-Hanusia_phi.AAC.2
MQQREAADYLGISLTALKVACRRMGLPKWPYIRKAASKGSSNSDDEPAKSQRSADANNAPIIADRLWWPIGSDTEEKCSMFKDQEILDYSLTSWGLSSFGQALWMDEALRHCEFS